VIQSIPCRLCASQAKYRFCKRILADTRACNYFVCEKCGSLQTEFPSWLHHSYSDTFHTVGVDSAYRSIWAQSLVHYCASVLRIRGKILDWGGGHGLLCRLLRDLGHDAWLHDPHTENLYASGFQSETLSGFSLITAFEVFEHLAEPAAEAGAIFAASPDFVIVGTGRFQGQGSDWDYLFPHHGQHVFFWSRKAHDWIARQHGYDVITCGTTVTVYARRLSTRRAQRILIGACEYGAKTMQAVIPFLRRPGARRDQDEIIALVTSKAARGNYE